jgi:hypothetical protein
MSAKSASKAGEQGTRPSADRYAASAAGAPGNPGPTVWIRRNPPPERRTSGRRTHRSGRSGRPARDSRRLTYPFIGSITRRAGHNPVRPAHRPAGAGEVVREVRVPGWSGPSTRSESTTSGSPTAIACRALSARSGRIWADVLGGSVSRGVRAEHAPWVDRAPRRSRWYYQRGRPAASMAIAQVKSRIGPAVLDLLQSPETHLRREALLVDDHRP